jgi:hypothetical protein
MSDAYKPPWMETKAPGHGGGVSTGSGSATHPLSSLAKKKSGDPWNGNENLQGGGRHARAAVANPGPRKEPRRARKAMYLGNKHPFFG